MSTLAEVKTQMEIWAAKEELAAVAGAVRLGKEARRWLAGATPIRSGRSCASWNAALNNKDESVKEEDYDNPSGAMEDGNENIDSLVLGDTIVVSNSIDYLGLIDNRGTKSHPAGFIERAVELVKVNAGDIVSGRVVVPTTADPSHYRV